MGYPRTIRIPAAPNDEVGVPDSDIERCETHDVLYESGGRCLDCVREGSQ